MPFHLLHWLWSQPNPTTNPTTNPLRAVDEEEVKALSPKTHEDVSFDDNCPETITASSVSPSGSMSSAKEAKISANKSSFGIANPSLPDPFVNETGESALNEDRPVPYTCRVPTANLDRVHDAAKYERHSDAKDVEEKDLLEQRTGDGKPKQTKERVSEKGTAGPSPPSLYGRPKLNATTPRTLPSKNLKLSKPCLKPLRTAPAAPHPVYTSSPADTRWRPKTLTNPAAQTAPPQSSPTPHTPAPNA
ncbi:hypothetical protein OPT61_g8682 [Boeremia exigua]|uniref:Uncharacterized protein n=1 Tax=Boeremia exigua TaxID=749465 RepID=A0ACC2HX90_9PLEO|nr:hypothetical protein OPT61_g8682 [Boeremia exigua]